MTVNDQLRTGNKHFGIPTSNAVKFTQKKTNYVTGIGAFCSQITVKCIKDPFEHFKSSAFYCVQNPDPDPIDLLLLSLKETNGLNPVDIGLKM